jgi:hypothetical protein
MKSCQGSRFNFGRPVGAVGMAAAVVSSQLFILFMRWTDILQVERAFLLFITGERAEISSIGNFSREKVGHMVDDYVENAKKLSDCRWGLIEESCGLKIQQEQPALLNGPQMQEKRRALYMPSSPMNSDGEWTVCPPTPPFLHSRLHFCTEPAKSSITSSIHPIAAISRPPLLPFRPALLSRRYFNPFKPTFFLSHSFAVVSHLFFWSLSCLLSSLLSCLLSLSLSCLLSLSLSCLLSLPPLCLLSLSFYVVFCHFHIPNSQYLHFNAPFRVVLRRFLPTVTVLKSALAA